MGAKPRKPLQPVRPSFRSWFLENVDSKPSSINLLKIKKVRELKESSEYERRLFASKTYREWQEAHNFQSRPSSLVDLGIDQMVSDYLSRVLRFSGTESVLSIGSKDAAVENFLAKFYVTSGKVFCLDFAHQMNVRAKTFTKKMNSTNLFFITGDVSKGVTGDARTIPFAGHSQDVVLLLNVPLMSVDFEEVVSRIRAVIRNSRKSKFVYCTAIDSMRDVDVKISIVEKNGFRIVDRVVLRKPYSLVLFFTAEPIID